MNMVGMSELKLGDSAVCGAAKRMNRVQLLLSACTVVFVVAACCGALRSSEKRVLLSMIVRRVRRVRPNLLLLVACLA
jgi:hypothetical protein